MAITSFSSSETVAQLFSSMCYKMLVYSCIFVIRLGDASGTEMNFYYFECLNNKTIICNVFYSLTISLNLWKYCSLYTSCSQTGCDVLKNACDACNEFKSQKQVLFGKSQDSCKLTHTQKQVHVTRNGSLKCRSDTFQYAWSYTIIIWTIFQFFSLSLCVSLFPFCPSLFEILPIPGKRRFAPQTCNVREITAFFRYFFPPLYLFHTPGSILPLLRLSERGHLAGMRFIMKSSLSLEDSRPERVEKKVCLCR